MRPNPRIHDRNLWIKSALGLTAWLPGMGARPGDLLVLNYHGTPARFLGEFERQVRFYRERFRVIGPAELEAYAAGELVEVDRPSLLVTFDDGLRNQLGAAAVLEKYGMRGLFFVVPDFVDSPEDEQPAFYQGHIKPRIDRRIDGAPQDVSSMGWADARALWGAGHRIGSHSASHLLRAGEGDAASRQREIVDSRVRIERALDGGPVTAFCGPVDSRRSVGVDEMALVMETYDTFHSTLPGPNRGLREPYLVRRIHVESHWPFAAVRHALGRLDWRRWEARRRRYLRDVVEPARRRARSAATPR